MGVSRLGGRGENTTPRPIFTLTGYADDEHAAFVVGTVAKDGGILLT